VILMGAGGRDFHDFNVVYRDDPEVEVIAFTATQIPGIEGRTYPPSLAGPRYPLLGPRSTMLESKKPVLAVCAVRTGAGKSQTSREIGHILLEAGLQVALLRHPMPYHDLDRIAVQRFASLADIDQSDPTVEEREEYERPVEMGIVVYAGIDYGEILARAEREAEVIIWDGGNNDLPFIRPDLLLVVVDPLRAGDELNYHPGEVNLRMADVIIVNKVDSATGDQVRRVLDDIALANPDAAVIEAVSPVSLAEGPSLAGKTVLVVEDGPSITHGGMSFGAGTVAARQAGVGTQIDPRPFAVGSIAETYRRFPHIGPVLPAMGYSHEQLRELEQTINATDCDAVIGGTPIDLARVIGSDHPIRRASYEFEQRSGPSLMEVLSGVPGLGAR
jgi:predicted GTPase